VSNWIAIPFSVLSGSMPDRAGSMPAVPGDACAPQSLANPHWLFKLQVV